MVSMENVLTVLLIELAKIPSGIPPASRLFHCHTTPENQVSFSTWYQMNMLSCLRIHHMD